MRYTLTLIVMLAACAACLAEPRPIPGAADAAASAAAAEARDAELDAAAVYLEKVRANAPKKDQDTAWAEYQDKVAARKAKVKDAKAAKDAKPKGK